MLFVSGLELALHTLLNKRHKILSLGRLQVAFSIGAISWLIGVGRQRLAN